MVALGCDRVQQVALVQAGSGPDLVHDGYSHRPVAVEGSSRDASDMNSPERQQANIERVCREHGWTPEWYVDAEGHKSARTVNNRPG
ncbi:MAG: hypothetical protein KBH93_00420 [Anaerolineae bacterium]|nr:hypothetical protein [Anaerolineae bacterium]